MLRTSYIDLTKTVKSQIWNIRKVISEWYLGDSVGERVWFTKVHITLKFRNFQYNYKEKIRVSFKRESKLSIRNERELISMQELLSHINSPKLLTYFLSVIITTINKRLSKCTVNTPFVNAYEELDRLRSRYPFRIDLNSALIARFLV